MNGVTAMDEMGEGVKSPIKRLGSTRKLMLFNSKCLLDFPVFSTRFFLLFLFCWSFALLEVFGFYCENTNEN